MRVFCFSFRVFSSARPKEPTTNSGRIKLRQDVYIGAGCGRGSHMAPQGPGNCSCQDLWLAAHCIYVCGYRIMMVLSRDLLPGRELLEGPKGSVGIVPPWVSLLVGGYLGEKGHICNGTAGVVEGGLLLPIGEHAASSILTRSRLSAVPPWQVRCKIPGFQSTAR